MINPCLVVRYWGKTTDGLFLFESLDGIFELQTEKERL